MADKILGVTISRQHNRKRINNPERRRLNILDFISQSLIRLNCFSRLKFRFAAHRAGLFQFTFADAPFHLPFFWPRVTLTLFTHPGLFIFDPFRVGFLSSPSISFYFAAHMAALFQLSFPDAPICVLLFWPRVALASFTHPGLIRFDPFSVGLL